MIQALTIVTLLVLFSVYSSSRTTANSISYSYCSDGNCAAGTCSSQNLPTGQCLQIQGSTSTSVKLSCSNASNIFCSGAGFYSDSKCTDRIANADTVCNSCQNGYSIACGALFGATFITNNCTLPDGDNDPTCNSCAGPTIVPYKQCHSLPQTTNYVMIESPAPCNGVVNWELYQNSSTCEGTPVQAQYQSGHCNIGQTFTCNSFSGEALKLVKQQKTINIDISKLKLMKKH